MLPELRPGRPDPLGATFDGEGVNFAVYSEDATAIELCLFDEVGNERRLLLPERTRFVWHGHLAGVRPGQRYGFRAHGPYEPSRGLRFNPFKLLADPYARAFVGKADVRAPLWGFAAPDDRVRDEHDSARGVPKCVVVDGRFDWRGDRAPDVPWRDTVLYEAHVKGMTMRMPGVPEAHRGTYRGLGSDAVIAHLTDIGVTAIELLPVHEAMDEVHVATRGMTNYWGYSTLGFFAPDQRFGTVDDFKEMVRALHAARIEVLLDVVYNHTAEADHAGPTVCLRGLDNRTYYALQPHDASRYADYTGCGNSLCLDHPAALALVMDSLRYWVTEMHVDGFRFDLAPTLARNASGAFDPRHPLLMAIGQDPVLSRVKLVAEPWDLGPHGFQLGAFPARWSEWNAKYRDAARRFWLGNTHVVGEMGYRLTGSSDLFSARGRDSFASVNFITAHDGFTLRDLVSYSKKHNLANGENNRDGWDDNASDNCGAEGETSDAKVLALRARQQRNMLVTLLLSQGVPMLTAGDELGKTQRGNNNAYVQDNEVSWLDWELDEPRAELLGFVRELARLRRAHPVFRRRAFFSGAPVRGSRHKDIVWFRSDGHEMSARDWHVPTLAFLAMLLAGDALPDREEDGRRCVDDTFLVLLSAHGHPLRVKLPEAVWGDTWECVVDTTRGGAASDGAALSRAGERVSMAPRSALVLRRVAPVSGSWRPPRSHGAG